MRETAVKLSLVLEFPCVGLIVALVLAVALIAGGLYLFASGGPDSEWRVYRASSGAAPGHHPRLAGLGARPPRRMPILFGDAGVLGAFYRRHRAGTTTSWTRLSVPVENDDRVRCHRRNLRPVDCAVARGAGKAS